MGVYVSVSVCTRVWWVHVCVHILISFLRVFFNKDINIIFVNF